MKNGNSEVYLSLYGVHFVNNGSVYMSAAERNQLWFEDLLRSMPSEALFDKIKPLLLSIINDKIRKYDEMFIRGEETIVEHVPVHTTPASCRYVLLLQLHPLSPSTSASPDLSQTIFHKTLTSFRIPLLSASLFTYSPDCKVSSISQDVKGIQLIKYYSKAVSYAIMACLVTVVQIYLVRMQIKYNSSALGLSRVSYWTIAVQAIMDGYLCLLHITTGILIESVFFPLASAAFFSFVLVSLFEMRYLLAIWHVQKSEVVSVRSGVGIVTQRGTTSAPHGRMHSSPLPSANDSKSELGGICAKCYVGLLVGVFIIIRSASFSDLFQDIVAILLVLSMFSFWVPQILRNVIRNTRRGLNLYYVVGMSFTRLVMPLYFLACPKNVLGREPSPLIYVIMSYVGAQVLILIAQECFGPRFFVPAKYLPPTHDYHPILDEMLAAGRCCAICMTAVDVSERKSRNEHMVTPCCHVFHTGCLEQWMKIKLECPICRSHLPIS
ncbi:5094_t:CDS:2 [Paraglomus brasilianum]|uniref:RING-type E3 ubiquitin transferase n=1 Tax=Paraglomus brasilianum TaxID=144538 RepID=A0A9N8VLN8_9GLOM|nr:5094_t:CDS:2 [Paraglomus brasilianum]